MLTYKKVYNKAYFSSYLMLQMTLATGTLVSGHCLNLKLHHQFNL